MSSSTLSIEKVQAIRLRNFVFLRDGKKFNRTAQKHPSMRQILMSNPGYGYGSGYGYGDGDGSGSGDG